MKQVTEEQVTKWMPRVGFHDFAALAVSHLWRDTPQHRNVYETAQAAPAAVLLWGLARHAAIGSEKPHFVEIGTQGGQSTRALLAVAAALGGHVTSMDIDPSCGEGPLRRWVEERGLTDNWTFIAGPSQEQPAIQGADLLLVDGDHSYDAVCADMALHAPAVRNGGIIILDDYYQGFHGKMRWVQERWCDIRPLTIGPWAILTKAPGDEVAYRKEIKNENWIWEF